MTARPTARSLGTALVLPAALALALALAGCGTATTAGGAGTGSVSSLPVVPPSSTSEPPTSPASSSPSTPPATAGPVTITGVPERGVEASCIVLQGYTLNGGDRALLTSGRTLRITGHTDPRLASYCQQGTILIVDSVVATY